MISLNIKFETKILDIGYLLMLKMTKEPNFQLDQKFTSLYIRLLSQQGKFKEALDFIEMRSDFFEENKLEKLLLQANLFYLQGKELLAIGLYFNLLRLNSNLH